MCHLYVLLRVRVFKCLAAYLLNESKNFATLSFARSSLSLITLFFGFLFCNSFCKATNKPRPFAGVTKLGTFAEVSYNWYSHNLQVQERQVLRSPYYVRVLRNNIHSQYQQPLCMCLWGLRGIPLTLAIIKCAYYTLLCNQPFQHYKRDCYIGAAFKASNRNWVV